MPTHPYRWTPDRVQELRALMEVRGLSWAEAAQVLGSTRARVLQIGLKYGIRSRVPPHAPKGDRNGRRTKPESWLTPQRAVQVAPRE